MTTKKEQQEFEDIISLDSRAYLKNCRGLPRPLPDYYRHIEPVDVVGYIPLQKRIEGMILAGERLVEARAELYDTEGDEYLDDPADIRIRDVYETDLAILTQMQLHLQESVKLYDAYLKEEDDKSKFSKLMADSDSQINDMIDSRLNYLDNLKNKSKTEQKDTDE